jgi:glutathione S-transferase
VLVLYVGDKHFSGWSMRGRIAVMEKQVPYQERIVELDWPTHETDGGLLIVGDGDDRREARSGCGCGADDLMRLDAEGLLENSAASVLPRVPVLVDEVSGSVASDIVALAELLDELYPDSGTRLMGADLRTRAAVRSVAAWAHQDLGHLVGEATYALSLRPGRSGVEMTNRAAQQAAWVCQTVEVLLRRSGGPWVFGEFTLADVMLSTNFQQLHGWRFPIAAAAVQEYAGQLLARWSVARHLDEARGPYVKIEASRSGSPAWILAHYRYNPRQRLLHDWQSDRCVRLSNQSAVDIVERCIAGDPREQIVAGVAARHRSSPERVRGDVDRLLRDLTPGPEDADGGHVDA